MHNGPETELPDTLVELLDGNDLEHKVGDTFVLTACRRDGWPHVALLSVGEVYAPRPHELRLALYATSRTTGALTEDGRGLMLCVVDESAYKIRFTAERVSEALTEGEANALFFCDVVDVDRDKVGYARLARGIEFELYDPEAVIGHWQRKLTTLKNMTRQGA